MRGCPFKNLSCLLFPYRSLMNPRHDKTYDNEEIVRRMVATQKNLKIPSELMPKCTVCDAPMTMNLRCDNFFVQDEGWYAASSRYEDFIRRHKNLHILFLELGVGANTPAIIKYPFWQMTSQNSHATYACINYGEAVVPGEIEKQSICINEKIEAILYALTQSEVLELTVSAPTGFKSRLPFGESSHIPPLLIAEGHLEVCFLAKRNGGLDYSKPPKKSAVQESVQNPLPVSGFFFSAARQHTPPCQSHTVIPLPAFVQSGIVFSVCGLSKQTRSVPFRTTPE